jgi:hypothetical protein
MRLKIVTVYLYNSGYVTLARRAAIP